MPNIRLQAEVAREPYAWVKLWLVRQTADTLRRYKSHLPAWIFLCSMYVLCGLAACGFPRPPDLVATGPVCGDGVQENGEVCDDGNNADGDGCNATCTAATCLVPVTHPTIAAILTDPQCVIARVYSGTYTENLTISSAVTLEGVGAAPVIVDGRGAGSVTTISNGIVVLQNLTLRNGRAATGAGVLNHAPLTLRHMRIEGNTASAKVGQGGGVYNDGNSLVMIDTIITGNHATTDGIGTMSGASGAGLYSASGGVIITGGSIDNNDIQITEVSGVMATGAGVAVADGTLLLNGTMITSNSIDVDGHPGSGTGSGGGLYVSGPAALTLTGATISNNKVHVAGVMATGFGAGMFHGDVAVSNSQIDDNVLQVNGDISAVAQGGGLYMNGDNMAMFTKSRIDRNIVTVFCDPPQGSSCPAGAGGGASFESQNASVLIDSSEIASNSVIASRGSSATGLDSSLAIGAGVNWNSNFQSGLMVVRRSTLSGNIAHAGFADGGGLFATCSHGKHTLALSQSTVSGNRADARLSSQGGGVYLEATIDSTMSESMGMSVSNSTFSGNATTASAGGAGGGGFALAMGGVRSGDVAIDLASSTFTGNSAQGSSASNGGGLLLGASGGTTRTAIRNTIVSGNIGSTQDCSAAQVSGGTLSITSQGFNIFGSVTGCPITATTGDLLSTAPMLTPLADNGGPTFTHALLTGSPAINAGNPAGCVDQFGNALQQDQRGMPRVSNARCDIGAYEK